MAIMSTLPQRLTASAGDSLGYHVLGFDNKTGDRLEMLRVRPQFSSHGPFEIALRNRMRQLADFGDAAFARVRQIDRLAGPAPGPAPSIVIVSDHVLGVRLGDVLSVGILRSSHRHRYGPEPGAAAHRGNRAAARVRR